MHTINLREPSDQLIQFKPSTNSLILSRKALGSHKNVISIYLADSYNNLQTYCVVVRLNKYQYFIKVTLYRNLYKKHHRMNGEVNLATPFLSSNKSLKRL